MQTAWDFKTNGIFSIFLFVCVFSLLGYTFTRSTLFNFINGTGPILSPDRINSITNSQIERLPQNTNPLKRMSCNHINHHSVKKEVVTEPRLDAIKD